MWKESLLQGLIALLPVFLFLVWYDRPGRTRYAALFLGLFCGIAMLLNLRYSMHLEQGPRMELGLVPLLVGSLFGGLPVAVSLSVLFAVLHYSDINSMLEFVQLLLFIAIFFPLLYRFSSIYLKESGSRRFRIMVWLLGIIYLFLLFMMADNYAVEPPSLIWKEAKIISVFSAVFIGSAIAGVKFVELGFDRVRLQSELQVMSHKYKGEMSRLQQVIDQAPLIVILLDASGIVTHINDNCLKFIQPFGREDVVHRHYRHLPRLFNQETSNPVDKVMQGQDRVVELLDYNGIVMYTVTCVLKGAAGQPPDGYLFIGHDITELQKLKDELSRMERLSLVGQMAASITHEIRNPMAVIRGFVQLLTERGSTDQHSYYRIIMEELDRTNGIINDFLSLAQNRIVEKESGSLHDVLNELMPLLRADANMRGQIVDLWLCEEMEGLEINSKEIKQLVLNLARNGMEAMGDNDVLRIETVNLADTVQLRVTDHGVGIPREKMDRLFEPFYTTKSNGTGLGLALCLSIVERHNGKIHVESWVGKGTMVIVSFCKPGRKCW